MTSEVAHGWSPETPLSFPHPSGPSYPHCLPLPSLCSALSGNALGLRPGTGLLGGAACEFVLGALLAFVVLWSAQLRSG
jgi:hypothetical protein